MLIYDVVLVGSEAAYEYASDVAQCGAMLSECDVYDDECPLHSRPEGPVINGVQIWYCYGADYYFFEDVTGE